MKQVFEIDWVDDTTWDAFIQTSNQNNVFSQSQVIKCFDLDYKFLTVRKNGEALLGFPIIFDEYKQSTFLPYLYYQAPLFSKIIDQMVNHRRYNYIQQLTETALVALTSNFASLAFKTHPSITDMRPYLRFKTDQLVGVTIIPNYTAVVTPVETGIVELKKKYRKDRRQDLKYASSAGFEISEINDVEILLDIVSQNFLRKGVGFPDYDRTVLGNIARLSQKGGFGRIYGVKTSTGEIVAAQFVLLDSKTMHAVATGAKDEHDQGVGSMLVHHCIIEALKNNLSFDFNGANSAYLADFKHSFNAELKTYFKILWRKN
jgi:hypothetical protein